jgi:hypothetical protein
MSETQLDIDLPSFVWMDTDVTTIKMAELAQSMFPG